MNQQLINILKEVSRNEPSITSIRLVYKKLGPIEAQQIVDALKTNSFVTHLRLDSNKLGDRGTQILAHHVAISLTLQEVNLASNGIHDEGICAIADALKHNVTVTNLKINQNYIGTTGATALGEALRLNKTLKSLNVSCKTLSAAGIGHIAKGLKHNESLTSLHLAGSACGSQGISYLSEAIKVVFMPWSILSLQSNRSLRLLDLSDCGIDKESVGLLMAGIKAAIRITQLRTVNLDYNNLAPELIEKITKLFDTIAMYRRSKLVSLINPSFETSQYQVNVTCKLEDKSLMCVVPPITVKTTTTTIMKITPIPALQKTSSMDAFARQLSPKGPPVGPSVTDLPKSQPNKKILQLHVPAKVVTTTTVETKIMTSPTADLRAPPTLLMESPSTDQ